MPSPVLCVDDSALARAAVLRALRERGIAALALGSAAEAAGVDPRGVAAALLDLELGDGSGVEVAQRLRAAVPGLPVAFLTAGGPVRLLDEAQRLGPVFDKTGGLDGAIRWILGVLSPVGAAASD
jgi:CheY-like chemotaxis protein